MSSPSDGWDVSVITPTKPKMDKGLRRLNTFDASQQSPEEDLETQGCDEVIEASGGEYETPVQAGWYGALTKSTDPIVEMWREPMMRAMSDSGALRGAQLRPVTLVNHCVGANGFSTLSAVCLTLEEMLM